MRPLIPMLIAGLQFTMACNEPAPTPFSILLIAADEDRPVEGTRFWIDGRDVGVSDAAGRVSARVHGYAGHTVEVTAACPPGHAGPDAPRRLSLQDHDRPVEIGFSCRRLERLAALVVRADHGRALHLPIRVNGETVGQTGPEGHAHTLLKLQPGERVRVELDTTAHPRLRPEHPVRTFQTGDDDSILLFDQTFTEPIPHRRKTRRTPFTTATTPARKIPYRIQ